MSTEAYAIKSELDLLTDIEKQLKESLKSLGTFMRDPNKFLIQKEEFEEKLEEFSTNVFPPVEMLETPMPMEGQPQPQPQQQMPQQQEAQTEKTTGLLIRAVLVAVAIIAAGILEIRSQVVIPTPQVVNGTLSTKPTVIQTGYVPPGTFQWVAVGSILVLSMPWIMDSVRRLIESRHKEAEMLSVEWISKNLNYIREKYLDAHLAILDQPPPPRPPKKKPKQEQQPSEAEEEEEEAPQIFDDVLHNRARYLQATLSTEFQSILEEIYRAANKAIWIRKRMLISALVQTRMAVGRMGR